jgi:transcriptional regulator with GAF, ATPase, and Fis domain
MSREQQLARAFVGLSDTLSAEFDPLTLFHRLVGDCVALLDADAAAVMMANTHGALRTMAASSEEAAFLELLQLQSGAGPCVDCYRSGEPTGTPDISLAADRWPEFVPSALKMGYRSVHTVPLRLHDRVLGALNIFSRETGDMAGDDEQLAQAMADVAALALMHWSAEPAGETEIVTRVRSALAAKAVLETAKGMVAQYADVSIAEATRMLRAYARRRHTGLASVAQDLTSRRLDLAAVTAPTD